MGVAVMPLGELSHAEIQTMLRRHFGESRLTWFKRSELKRRPLSAIAKLRREHVEAAVLAAPDLDQPRLRLTSLLLALPNANKRWRIDARGRRERWIFSEHMARNTVPVLRHVLACALAALAARPLLQAVNALCGPRPIQTKTPPIKILYLRSQLWLGLAGGGSVAHTAGVVAGLQDCGVGVHVVSSDALGGVHAPISILRPEVWFDGWLRELEDLAFNVPFLLGALKASRATRPDAIYQRHATFNIAGAVLSRIVRRPFVLEFNSSEVWKGRYWGGLRLVGLAQRVERINLRAADRIVVVSRVLRDDLVRGGVPQHKIVVNPNGVDTRIFCPDRDGASVRAKLDIQPTEVVVGFSGTFGAWHGIPTLAQAIPLVLQQSDRVRWLLLGDGPLRGLIHNGERVIQAGMLPHADMPNYLAACDILVSPHGRQADGAEFFGSPTKLYEYMAMGRPIVASRVGQIGDVLVDGGSALLVPPDDARVLSEAILRLVDDPCLRARLGSAARKLAEDEHTWRHNAERVLESLQRW